MVEFEKMFPEYSFVILKRFSIMIDCHAELACLHRAVSAEAGFGILHHFFLDAELIPINIGTAWRVFMILNRYLLGRETDNHKISRSNSKSIKVIADQQLKG